LKHLVVTKPVQFQFAALWLPVVSSSLPVFTVAEFEQQVTDRLKHVLSRELAVSVDNFLVKFPCSFNLFSLDIQYKDEFLLRHFTDYSPQIEELLEHV
jgi:hypothetical protein